MQKKAQFYFIPPLLILAFYRIIVPFQNEEINNVLWSESEIMNI